jgi:hypothetical protein
LRIECQDSVRSLFHIKLAAQGAELRETTSRSKSIRKNYRHTIKIYRKKGQKKVPSYPPATNFKSLQPSGHQL